MSESVIYMSGFESRYRQGLLVALVEGLSGSNMLKVICDESPDYWCELLKGVATEKVAWNVNRVGSLWSIEIRPRNAPSSESGSCCGKCHG